MTILPRTDTNERQGRQSNCIRANSYSIQVAKSNFRNGGANLPVCRDDPQVVAHLFGNLFWQLLYAQEFRSLRKFSRRVVARASRPCVSGPPQPQLSRPYTGETRATTFWLPLRR